MHSSALTGLTVIDLTRLLPGPLATKHLADFGARVIKVQAPDAALGDYAKTMGAASDLDGDASYFYRHCNAGKADVYLDLKQPADREALLAMVRTADALIESFRPGVMAKLGLSFETLQTHNPTISMVSITGYGQRGGWAGAAGHDINYMALSGQLIEFCTPYGEINLPNMQYGDLLGGAMTGAFATLAAVMQAKLQGVGCWMDVSMTASLLAHNVMPLCAVQAVGQAPQAAHALLNGGVACYRAYATQDGKYFAVGALELKFWQAFCYALGRADWARQHWSLGSHEAGDDAALALVREVAGIIGSQTLAHWLAALDGVDCCCTPVLTMVEALEHPVNQAFGTLGYRQTTTGREVPTVGAAFKSVTS